MKHAWNRIVELRGKGGSAEGLEYHYPCGHSAFTSAGDILAALQDPSKWTEGGGLVEFSACSTCPAEDPAVDLVVEGLKQELNA